MKINARKEVTAKEFRTIMELLSTGEQSNIDLAKSLMTNLTFALHPEELYYIRIKMAKSRKGANAFDGRTLCEMRQAMDSYCWYTNKMKELDEREQRRILERNGKNSGVGNKICDTCGL